MIGTHHKTGTVLMEQALDQPYLAASSASTIPFHPCLDSLPSPLHRLERTKRALLWQLMLELTKLSASSRLIKPKWSGCVPPPMPEAKAEEVANSSIGALFGLLPQQAPPLRIPRICVDEHARTPIPARLLAQPVVHVVRDPLEVRPPHLG